MALIDVTPEQLREAAKTIRNEAENFHTATQSASTAAANLQGMWEGDSQVRFADQVERNTAWFNQMYNIVLEYAQFMENAAGTFQMGDASTAGKIGSR